MVSKVIMDIAKEVERCFWGDMDELMCEPESRYEFNRSAVENAIQTYCIEHNCDPKRQYCRLGYWDESDHLCDYIALYINGERQCEVVKEKPRKSLFPRVSLPPADHRYHYYGNPMSFDSYEPDWESAILERQEMEDI